MANPVWPGTLPSYLQEPGYQEKFQDQTVESQMDTGPAKIRRRFTKAIRFIQASMLLTADQVSAFETFWVTTCKGGSIPFDWVHPRTQSTTTFRFRSPAPAYQTVGGVNVQVTFTLEVV